MKKWEILALVLAFMMSACGRVSIGTGQSPVMPDAINFAAPAFIFQGQDPSKPILTRHPSPEIDNLYINPGAMIYHNGKFHMFFNSFTAWPGVIEVGYATSVDGYQWQMVQDRPILTTDQVPFGNGHADVSSVVIMDDGTWVLYFHTISGGEIGRASAPSASGPWTVDPEPVLKPGPKGSWDQYGIAWPSVVRDGDQLRMYYGGTNIQDTAIGFATSGDGIHWTKYNDPETIEEAYVESDPVMTLTDNWEAGKVDRPRVQKTSDGWVMIYQSGQIEWRGLALSLDGVVWEKYPQNPVFNADTFPIPRSKTWDTNLLYHEGTYYYFMELGTLSGTDIFLTTHQGPLNIQ